MDPHEIVEYNHIVKGMKEDKNAEKRINLVSSYEDESSVCFTIFLIRFFISIVKHTP